MNSTFVYVYQNFTYSPEITIPNERLSEEAYTYTENRR